MYAHAFLFCALQAPLISASLEMKHEIQQLRKEVAELRTCLSEKVRASAIIPRASDAIHQTQSHYTHMQYIPLMMYSGPQPEGLEEAPKYGMRFGALSSL